MEKTCFVVSPIGPAGTEIYEQFEEVLNALIKPAFEKAGKLLGIDFTVRRADEIAGSGSFMKDIIENLFTAFVVVADLTNQNPNVFYELGMRHAFGPRTILIAETFDDIPSDLRSYRVITYERSLKGQARFADALLKTLEEIVQNPDKADNPVLDHIPTHGSPPSGSSKTVKASDAGQGLEAAAITDTPHPPDVRARVTRLTRVMKLRHSEKATASVATISVARDDLSSIAQIPTSQGRFELYTHESQTKQLTDQVVYIAVLDPGSDPAAEFPDARVLMADCDDDVSPPYDVTFVVAGEPLEHVERARERFAEILEKLGVTQRGRFSLEIWDGSRLSTMEAEVGLIFKD